MNTRAWIGSLAIVLIGSAMIWHGGNSGSGIAGWETLNTAMEQTVVMEEEADSGIEVGAGTILETVADPIKVVKGRVGVSTEEAGNKPSAEAEDTGTVEDVEGIKAAADGKVNVNMASAAGLMELPGIGVKKAQAIIDYRSSHGPIRSLAELGKVKGIGPKMLEKLRPMVLF